MKALFAGQKVWLWCGLDAETREKLMHALVENGAPVQDGDWMQGAHSDGEFLVVDDVAKDEVQALKEHGGTIIGVEFVNQSVEQRRPLPKLGRILCCRALEGYKICLTGFTGFENERNRLSSKVIAMGAEVTNNFDGSITTVVSKNVINEKCKWAVTMRKPVVTMDWVETCWTKHAALPEDDFRLPVFAGLHICSTSLKAADKEKVKVLTWANGGTFDANLDSSCTHLVCGSTNSKKYSVATKWEPKTRVVTPEWIYKSVAAKGCLDETPFTPPPPDDALLPAALRSASQTSFGHTTRLASGTQGSLTLTRVVATPTPTDDESQGRADSGKFATTAGRDQDIAAQEPIGYGDDDKLFLSSCRLFFAGMTPRELQEAMRMMRASGATRYALLDERATHVVLGDSPDCDLTEIRKLESAGIVEVVRLSWLRACLQFRKLLPVSDKYRVPKDQLTASRTALKPSAVARPSQKQGLVQPAPSSGPQGGPVRDPDDDDSPNEPGSAEWEKLRESQRQASQRPYDFNTNGSRGGLGEGLGEVGDDPPVLEMRSDIFDDASRTGFGPAGRAADVIARPAVLGKRFMSPKRGDTWQKEGAASPKVSAAFSAEGGGAKTPMGPPARKWLEAARVPVKPNPVSNGDTTDGHPGNGLSEGGETNTGVRANPVHNQRSEPGQSERRGSARLRAGLKQETGVTSAGGSEWGTPGATQPTPAASQIPESSDVFRGLRFHIDASMSPSGQEDSVKRVRQGLGDIEGDPSKSVHFSVVDHGFDAASTMVPPGAEVVTFWWIMRCLKERRLVPLDDRPYLRPLPHAVPLPGFDSVTICLTKYERKDHERLKGLAICLGGKTSERLVHSVTHVVAKYAEGEKYREMVRRGRPVATGEWLLACAQQGRLVPVDGFAPPPMPADVSPVPARARSSAPSQQARSPGNAEASAQGQSSMPPPRTRGASRASQASQPASQPQRKRPKKESPQPRPGDFEHMEDMAATWTGSQAPSPPKLAKPPLNLRSESERGGAAPSLGVNAPSGGVKKPGKREGVEEEARGSARGGGVGSDAGSEGANRVAETAAEKRTETLKSGAVAEKEGEEKRAASERSGAVTSASELAQKGEMGDGKTPLRGCSEGRGVEDETPSKNTRSSRRGVTSEVKAAPPSRGKRKSDERNSPGDAAPDSHETKRGGRSKQRKSPVPSGGEGHVALQKGRHVAEEELPGELQGKNEPIAGGAEAGPPGNSAEEPGDSRAGAKEVEKQDVAEGGPGAEGEKEEGDDKPTDFMLQIESLLEKLPGSSSARAEEKKEGGLKETEPKRLRVSKAWPVREPPTLLPHVSEGPWTRQRTAVVPAVAEDYRFQESQMESQMVVYDDGTAESRVRFAEQLRRSSRLSGPATVSGPRGTSRRSKPNDGLRNLIETANGNNAV